MDDDNRRYLFLIMGEVTAQWKQNSLMQIH